ncbi:hypothetical protein Pcaca03_05420 [Pectobacterium carotovorum subsp. carotovorum]|uniref:Uncharacterized protein n=1 Tax=Pectobacterium carotovorum subsp. carotovorum TaxID=555 RepID=A0AAI9KXR4_PECCC|nr:hypothetical protein RC99_07230 [Pectobacterium carotovorum subsp. carotovorum]MBD0845405.1 hypothetical protein [Pectobacterium carotovorum subsp. carotovorum]GKX45791.1 hypothetical protein SOASR016_05430 [Pectobacterium carotovorum subsp. carotovorum]GLV68098.1 hypothetical protein Pcaca03_05420 [Pectobacterium carotovorum subsp. carotovorum]
MPTPECIDQIGVITVRSFFIRYDGLPAANPPCGKLPFHYLLYLLFLVKAPGETDDVAWQ